MEKECERLAINVIQLYGCRTEDFELIIEYGKKGYINMTFKGEVDDVETVDEALAVLESLKMAVEDVKKMVSSLTLLTSGA